MAAPKLPQQFGPYTLRELIARGGMAEIFRATTMPGVGGFEKTVAIKKILPHLAENDEFITMLIDEARIIVSINHANIAQVYDLGRDRRRLLHRHGVHPWHRSLDDRQRAERAKPHRARRARVVHHVGDRRWTSRRAQQVRRDRTARSISFTAMSRRTTSSSAMPAT